MKKSIIILIGFLLGIVGSVMGQSHTSYLHKTLTVKAIKCTKPLKGEDIPSLLDKHQIEFHPIQEDTWRKSQHNPMAQFRIAHTGKEILIHYQVKESTVRAVADRDNGRVWEDACVEFFVSPEKNQVYYNFECNCIGKLLMQGGKLHSQRPVADSIHLAQIKRWSSLGTTPFGIKECNSPWELTLIIPLSAFYLHRMESFSGKVMTGNFYKCGNKLPSPHFLSWNRIETPKPQFHTPDYFGTLYFE